MLLALIYSCETLTLNRDLKERIETFCNKCLHIVIECCWDCRVSNDDRFVRLNEDLVTNLGLYGNVSRLKKVDPAHCRGLFFKYTALCEVAKRAAAELVAGVNRWILLEGTQQVCTDMPQQSPCSQQSTLQGGRSDVPPLLFPNVCFL